MTSVTEEKSGSGQERIRRKVLGAVLVGIDGPNGREVGYPPIVESRYLCRYILRHRSDRTVIVRVR